MLFLVDILELQVQPLATEHWQALNRLHPRHTIKRAITSINISRML